MEENTEEIIMYRKWTKRNLKTQQSPSYFWICVWWKFGQENRMAFATTSFLEKNLFLIVLRPIGKSKSRRFQISPVWRAFSWRISVDGRSDRRNKAAFLDFSAVVWKLPTMNFADFASFENLVGDLSLTQLVFVRFFLQWVQLWYIEVTWHISGF